MESINNTNKDILNVIFGSRTGNARSVAQLAYNYAFHLGFDVNLINMQEYDMKGFTDIRNALIIVSTHGEGEPPVQAENFHETVMKFSDMDLSTMNYAVLGLGDSSYRYFAQTGKDIDQKLHSLGAKRLLEVGTCDIDYEERSKAWVREAMDKMIPNLKKVRKSGEKPFIFEIPKGDGFLNAYRSAVLEKKLLTAEGSSKKVLHVSLSLKDSGIEYQPGDAIGVYSTNSRLFVDKMLRTIGFDPTYPVKVREDEVRLLKDALLSEYELTMLTPLVISKYAELAQSESLNDLVRDKEALKMYAETRDIIDLVSDFPANISVEDFLDVLRKLTPRLYSVASSQVVGKDQADLTVKVIENQGPKRIRTGVTSSLLWERILVGDRVAVYHEPIEKFRLPEDGRLPVIMIAAGTGIAPYRGFLQEREKHQAGGRNWLIFGERTRDMDFLYEDEIKQWKQNGTLDRVDTAFSRDGKEKVYVQHLIRENGSDIINWLDEGAHIYVCGSKSRMAVQVREALIDILEQEKSYSEEEAKQHFNELKAKRIYQEEVY